MNKDTIKLISDLFRNIAIEEQLIEEKRQELAQVPDFEPVRAFKSLHPRGGEIDAYDIVKFMNNNYAQIDKESVEMIIQEYDSNLDGKIDYEEFCQIFLPATDRTLSQICKNRLNSYYYEPNKPLDFQCVIKMVRQFERELSYQKIKQAIKRKLLKKEDFTKQRAFAEIAKYKEYITIEDLINLFQDNYFKPKREDLESILRRVDHTGDHNISFEEFCEIVSVNDQNVPFDQIEQSSYKSPQMDFAARRRSNSSSEFDSVQKNEQNNRGLIQKVESGTKKKIDNQRQKEDLSHKVGRGMNNKVSEGKSQEKLSQKVGRGQMMRIENQAQQEEDLQNKMGRGLNQKLESQQDVARRLNYDQNLYQGQKQQREESFEDDGEKPVKFRFMKLLKTLIVLDKEIEVKRQSLFAHSNFSPIELFSIFDKDKNGWISKDEFNRVAQEQDLYFFDIGKNLQLYDADKDDKLNYTEFLKSISPKKQVKSGKYRQQNQSKKEKELHKLEYLNEFAELYSKASEGNTMLLELRQEQGITKEQGEKLFSKIDTYKKGYFSINQFANWIQENCALNIFDDIQLLLDRYDTNGDQKISQEEFLEQIVSTRQVDEDEGTIYDLAEKIVDQMWDEFDVDHNGSLDKNEQQEFVHAFLAQMKESGGPTVDPKEMLQNLMKFDTNEDGLIQKHEFQYFFVAQMNLLEEQE